MNFPQLPGGQGKNLRKCFFNLKPERINLLRHEEGKARFGSMILLMFVFGSILDLSLFLDQFLDPWFLVFLRFHFLSNTSWKKYSWMKVTLMYILLTVDTRSRRVILCLIRWSDVTQSSSDVTRCRRNVSFLEVNRSLVEATGTQI